MEPLAVGKKVLVVKLRADYGHFKKYFTNMSPLTFHVPPPTALRGMLGAICGVDKREAPQYFSQVRMALKLVRAIRTTVVPINWVQTKSNVHFGMYKNHKPTNMEMLVDPVYRLLIHVPDPHKEALLEQKLEAHHSVYSLCFGLSELLANYTYEGAKKVVDQLPETDRCQGLVSGQSITKLNFSKREIFSVRLPLTMDNQRQVNAYHEFFYDRNGEDLLGTFTGANQVQDEGPLIFF